ncbi:hypothetical protein J7337_006683 [Fusarium musae]|uniref:Uncharacterized protein n=1 Tax=Fusarium musae TaxID=1042133 RepID=A0A9P8DFU6_9HYPO|nr:hypothetical protein J7337_006683 [Fusarium musae]KAG9501001.1 hypothetical protein J7337_006683 [Fusarium musae]
MKLLIGLSYPSTQAAGHNQRAEGARSGRNTDELVTDFIAQLVEHLMYTLREKLGSGLVKSTSLEFVIMVPAIWSDLAKEKTKKACEQAMISASEHHVHLVSEPEAAAIYALHDLDLNALHPGDTIVVVDTGGVHKVPYCFEVVVINFFAYHH